jgi:hypothetical protein
MRREDERMRKGRIGCMRKKDENEGMGRKERKEGMRGRNEKE